MVLKNNKILLILFALIIPAAAQDKPAVSSGEILFYMDKAAFYGTNEKSFVEFYLMFYADQFTFSNDKKQSAELLLNCKIKINENIIVEKDWTTVVSLPDKKSDLKTKVFYDQFNEYLKPGRYEIEISVNEKDQSNNSKLKSELIIPDLSGSKLILSEIEFVSSTANKNTDDHFSKGKKTIVPNPARRFGALNPTLFFYYEIYNVDNDKKTDLLAAYSVLDKEGNEIKKIDDVQINRPGKSAAVVHGIDVSNLSSGVYTLNLTITDSEITETISGSRNFEIIQDDFASDQVLISEDEAEMYETILSYIASSNVLDIYKRLNLKGKSEFLIQYWKNQDPEPDTAENEYLQKIQQRFLYAKQNFGWGEVKGWKTDKGRICIKYGLPDEVIEQNAEAQSAPYLIWIYQENRSYEFVFADLQNNGRYVLVHSNREGEISNSQWRDLIQKL